MIAVRRALVMVIFAAFTSVAAPPFVHALSDPASGSQHDSAAPHPSEPPAASFQDLLFPALNFGIYLFIVVRYAVPGMREYLRRRRTDIVQADSESRAALARAEQTLAISNSRLASLKAEADGIRQDLIAVATRQAERLTAQAEETGSRRLADASLVAEQERRHALADVRAAVARAAANLAEGQIRAALTPGDQRAFVQQFLKDASTR